MDIRITDMAMVVDGLVRNIIALLTEGLITAATMEDITTTTDTMAATIVTAMATTAEQTGLLTETAADRTDDLV